MANRLRLNTKVVQNGHVRICVVPLSMKMHETISILEKQTLWRIGCQRYSRVLKSLCVCECIWSPVAVHDKRKAGEKTEDCLILLEFETI